MKGSMIVRSLTSFRKCHQVTLKPRNLHHREESDQFGQDLLKKQIKDVFNHFVCQSVVNDDLDFD